MENQKKQRANPIFLCALGIYLSWQMYGVFGAIPGLRGLFNILMSIMVIALAAIYTPQFIDKALVDHEGKIYLLLFILLLLFDFIAGGDFSVLMMFLPVLVYFSSWIYLKDKKPSKGLIIWILLNFIFKIIVTFFFLPGESLIIKKYDHLGYASSDGITRSVMGYSAVYLIVPTIILLLSYYKKQTERRYKGFLILTIGLMLTIVLVSQVSMMLFATTILLTCYFVLKGENITKKTKTRMYVIVGILVLIYILRIEILETLLTWDFLGTTVLSRLQGLLDVLQGGMDYVSSNYTDMLEGDSVVNRFYSYRESFTALFHNFFLGYLTPNAHIVGGHSEIIDMWAKYGVLVAGAWIIIVQKTFKRNMRNHKTGKVAITLVYLYILLISILNNFSVNNVGIISYIFIPQLFGTEG